MEEKLNLEGVNKMSEPKRMNITCNKQEKQHLISLFVKDCPFIPCTKICNDDDFCKECIEKSIDFVIIKE